MTFRITYLSAWRTGLLAFLLASPLALSAAAAQPVRVSNAAPAAQLLDRLAADKLVWSTMIAIDQANRTGDYGVVRALGSESFQRANSEAQLAANFRPLRINQVDLSNTLILSAVYESAPAVERGVLRAKGIFPLRPVAIGFDLLFEQSGGGWKILGLFVAPLVRASGR